MYLKHKILVRSLGYLSHYHDNRKVEYQGDKRVPATSATETILCNKSKPGLVRENPKPQNRHQVERQMICLKERSVLSSTKNAFLMPDRRLGSVSGEVRRQYVSA